MGSRFCLPILAVVVAMVGGCSATIPGTAGPDTAPVPVTAFGVPVTAADKLTFDTLDQVRSVDPCGFADRARLGAEGVISLLGPSIKIDQCAIGFTPNGERNASYLYIELDHNPPLGSEQTRSIAGESIVVEGPDSYGNCDFKVPLRFPVITSGTENADVIEVPTVAYAAVSSSSFDSSEYGCRLAEDIVVEIIEAFRDQRIPRRSAAVTPASNIALMTHNPCEIVAALPGTVPLAQLQADFDPTACSFTTAGAHMLADPVSVTFNLTRRPLESFSADNRVITVDGVPVLIYQQPLGQPRCTETFSAGPELDPSTGTEDVSGAKVQPVVQITSSCAVTEQIRPAAMRLFGAVA
ncbi:hypothetical protein ACFWPX_22940 [Nocardia sp. NPDC058518]|uniref:hypothetical protein n=1 Tax=Nocardia sp. NPDC058518 TaxID=3346534 RepID=UPI0036636A27